jgi:uncharacterized protein (TIGR00288 family)
MVTPKLSQILAIIGCVFSLPVAIKEPSLALMFCPFASALAINQSILQKSRKDGERKFNVLTTQYERLIHQQQQHQATITEHAEKLHALVTQPPAQPKPDPGLISNTSTRPNGHKQVAIFIDAANLYHAAKKINLEIDYAKLLKELTGDRHLAFARIYLAEDTSQKRQNGFLQYIGDTGFEVISKPLTRRSDGSVKGNLDGEITTDMMKLLIEPSEIDTVFLISGDSDFACPVKTLRTHGLKVEIIGLKEQTSPALIKSADRFTNLANLQNQIRRHKYQEMKQLV